MPSVPSKALKEVASEFLVEETTPQWVYVSIPQRDILDSPFAGIGINLKHYGTTDNKHKCDCADAPKCNETGIHKVAPEVGDEIKRRLKLAQAQDMKLFSAKVNLKALAEIAGHNPSVEVEVTQ